MSIFGIFHRNGCTFPPPIIHNIQKTHSVFGVDQADTWASNCVWLGSTRLSFLEESLSPGVLSIPDHAKIVCTARLDNRIEIAADLKITAHELMQLDDRGLVCKAYGQWGEHCADHLYGDWSFAAWHEKERRLVVARDHFGMTSLYYYVDKNVFAFSSERSFLLALGLSPIELDELYLAQVLISWPAYHGDRTIHSPIRRLPPAHRLNVTSKRFEVQQYWFLEKTPELILSDHDAYREAFLDVFDEAVRSRVKTSYGREIVSTTLSGGLDSSSVTATAGRIKYLDGCRINAYTSTPVYETTRYVQARFGNELPLAEATANFSGNIDLFKVSAEDYSPIQAIRKSLEIHNEPGHSACNMYWLHKIMQEARSAGSKRLLVGQFGNATISWKGDIFSQPFSVQLRQLGAFTMMRGRLRRVLPGNIVKPRMRYNLKMYQEANVSAINHAFAERLSVFEQQLNDSDNYLTRTPFVQRCAGFLMPGRHNSGSLYAEMSRAFDIGIYDPTVDVRVMKFVFSVPDHIFIDQETGIDRWLIRDAMKGRIPDEVRLNRNRGRQAGDLVPRLRACASEVDDVLSELINGPASLYLDVPYMYEVWKMVLTQDTPDAFHKAITVLTRGIMAGLFVNNFYGSHAE